MKSSFRIPHWLNPTVCWLLEVTFVLNGCWQLIQTAFFPGIQSMNRFSGGRLIPGWCYFRRS
jgi:hypothetical protein